MANRRYELHFFNEYQKERYLKTLTENEQIIVKRLLGRAGKTESIYNKDLYDFSLPEIEKFLRHLNPNKITTSRMYVYTINNYIEWANKEGLRQSRISPLHGMIDEDFMRKFVDESKKTLFTEEEIDYYINKMVNYQDKVVPRLIFEGVTGEAVEELLNLHRKNIDFEKNHLLLTDKDKSTRIITVSERCMELIRGALDETEYQKRNGEAEGARAKEVQLIESDYVLKTGKIGRASDSETEKGDRYLVFRRLETIRELFEEPYLTVTNVRDSGMLKMAADLYFERGKLEKEEYHVISEQFGIGKIKLNGEYQYNYFPYKRTFLNVETIEKMYGETEEEQ